MFIRALLGACFSIKAASRANRKDRQEQLHNLLFKIKGQRNDDNQDCHHDEDHHQENFTATIWRAPSCCLTLHCPCNFSGIFEQLLGAEIPKVIVLGDYPLRLDNLFLVKDTLVLYIRRSLRMHAVVQFETLFRI